MTYSGRIGSGLAVVGIVLVAGGCVSLDEHRRLESLNRNLQAEKAGLNQELFDCRGTQDALRVRYEAALSDRETKDQLLANLRGENDLLDEMRKTAQAALEDMANRNMGGITIAAPALPEPLDNELKRFVDDHPGAVEYDPMRGTVKWKADLLFALGSDVVKQSSMGTLKHFTEILKSSAAAGFEVIVVGHTDNRPISRSATKAQHPTNWHLSSHRAIAVSSVLQKYAYAPERVAVMGCGEFRPVADNASEEGASRNRRVEIYIIPRGSIVHASAAPVDRRKAVASRAEMP